MATAETKTATKTVERVIVEEVKTETVVLELTLEEAEILRTLTGSCARNSATSPIFKALEPLVLKGRYKLVNHHTGRRADTIKVVPNEGSDW